MEPFLEYTVGPENGKILSLVHHGLLLMMFTVTTFTRVRHFEGAPWNRKIMKHRTGSRCSTLLQNLSFVCRRESDDVIRGTALGV